MTPKQKENNHSLDDLIKTLRKKYKTNITGELVIAPEQGEFRPLPEEIDAQLKIALQTRNITQLYSHQLEAWHAIQQGNHTVIVTPTASGKTLCYNLSVIHAVMKHKAKALYLFPTKALSQDQVAELTEINRSGLLGLKTYTFDGDTPGDARKAIRIKGDIVVTNPDMLHQGILPHHTKWAQFFESLTYVVIDEMHIYRGVFGAHIANLIKRLQRICRFYHTSPIFIFCSATIANPQQLATQLCGTKVICINQNGAPQGGKQLMFWNPPVINADLGIRASARSQATKIARYTIKKGLKTIIFANTRLMVEVITKYMKDIFDKDPRRPARIKAYRGGYLPTQRRTTEKQLRQGEIDCVISTTALELGVDIGSLDVCLLNGYPGTIAGTWQRLGRAGRRDRPALGILIASSQPLDQYIIRNPAFFLESQPERVNLNTEQLLILLDHIRCAAFELPFQDHEIFGNKDIEEFLSYLEQENTLHHEQNQWYWMDESYPANSVSLRSIAEGNFVIIDVSHGKKEIIAEVDFSSAAMTIYEGAIYMIQAQPWQVEKLDWEGRKAFVTKTKADYYTDAIDYTRLKILEEFKLDHHPNGLTAQGEIHLVRRIVGYKKIRYYSHENVGYGKINLPDQEIHTCAIWWQLKPEIIEQHFKNRWEAIDGFLGAAYAMHHIAILLTMTQPQDIGRAVGNSETNRFTPIARDKQNVSPVLPENAMQGMEQADTFKPTVFLYDNYPGGIGLAGQLFERKSEVIIKATEMISGCDCTQGCPACIGPILNEREYISAKKLALQVLALLVNHQASD